ncbi:zinc finger CCCH domain-containing protein 11A isoform X2 [Tribolium castaneum]
MTDLESPKKNNDCYFYYYSTCAKGDNCTFRHEPSALGCETMCSFWKEGKCLNVHCNFRHMELRKNRKAIPCYWESQPGGCLKPHCPFLHQSPKPAAANESHESKTDSGTGNEPIKATRDLIVVLESADNSMNEKFSHLSEKGFKNAPVDSLVVNFEEESDNESAPTNSPIKSNHRAVKVKTLEEIKLEKIQAESAAYYSYPEDDGEDLRQRIWERLSTKNPGFGLKRQHETNITGPLSKKPKKTETDVSEIKIKTLDEIRAERAKKTSQNSDAINICDSCVSSSTEDTQNEVKKAKIKLQREPAYIQEKKEQLNETKEVVDKTSDSDVDMSQSNNNKTADEILLLQDDDDNCNVSLKEEERLLNDLDDFLED